MPDADRFLPSVLDRLLDPATAAGFDRAAMEAAVMRDLEDLLSTPRPPASTFLTDAQGRAARAARRGGDPVAEVYAEVAASVANFGLRDEPYVDRGQAEVSRYMADMERVIAAFEPRLDQARVALPTADELAGGPPPAPGTVRFRITAELRTDPQPDDPRVTFVTAVELVSGRHTVAGGGGG